MRFVLPAFVEDDAAAGHGPRLAVAGLLALARLFPLAAAKAAKHAVKSGGDDDGSACASRDVWGRTPLHWAVINGHREAIVTLVRGDLPKLVRKAVAPLIVVCADPGLEALHGDAVTVHHIGHLGGIVDVQKLLGEASEAREREDNTLLDSMIYAQSQLQASVLKAFGSQAAAEE